MEHLDLQTGTGWGNERYAFLQQVRFQDPQTPWLLVAFEWGTGEDYQLIIPP